MYRKNVGNRQAAKNRRGKKFALNVDEAFMKSCGFRGIQNQFHSETGQSLT